ncbi:MAG: hypothetical protein GF313_02700 [Caldithrix sp.]|nr:hypothetical protein [Caldithrix sp.]
MLEEKTYTIKGMTCHHCVHSVSEALQKVTGVKDVEVSLDTSEAIIEIDPQTFDSAEAAQIVADAGYEMIL